jgi:hypothetical protein
MPDTSGSTYNDPETGKPTKLKSWGLTPEQEANLKKSNASDAKTGTNPDAPKPFMGMGRRSRKKSGKRNGKKTRKGGRR